MSHDTWEKAWAEKIAKYKDECKRVLGTSENIRYASVINNYGRTLTGTMRPGSKPMLRRDHAPNEFHLLAMLFSLRRDSEDQLGEMEHCVIHHKKVILVIVPRNKDIMFISFDKWTENPDAVIDQIKKVL